MKKILYVLGGLILVGLIWVVVAGFSGKNQKVAGYSTDDPNAPRAEIQEKKFDFGKIAVSDVAKHDFKIKNTGGDPLVIANIMTSCHCTTAILKISGQPDSPEFSMGKSNWNGNIPPGSEASLEVIYKPAVMPVNGQVSRVVTFSTNDPANKEVQLEIVANVQ